MTKTEQLANDLSVVLDASELGQDEKIKALGIARSRLNRVSASSLDQWRTQRAQTGILGSGKKADAMRELIPKKSSRSRP